MAYATFTFQVQDDGGTALAAVDLDPNAKVLTINILPVNDPPKGTSGAVATNEDTDYTFTAANFGFSDTAGETNTLQGVKIATLPSGGILYTGSVSNPVNVGDIVAATALKFHPNHERQRLAAVQLPVPGAG